MSFKFRALAKWFVDEEGEMLYIRWACGVLHPSEASYLWLKMEIHHLNNETELRNVVV